jgi:hypothetical protein
LDYEVRKRAVVTEMKSKVKSGGCDTILRLVYSLVGPADPARIACADPC